MSVASRRLLTPRPPATTHHGSETECSRDADEEMKRQFARVLLILVSAWIILIIIWSLSLIGPFSKSTITRDALIDHSVDTLQAYIGIKYPCTQSNSSSNDMEMILVPVQETKAKYV